MLVIQLGRRGKECILDEAAVIAIRENLEKTDF
jgi:hypothetical protein